MPPIVKDSGSQTAVLTTEHTLATITDAGVYQLVVDTVNLILGETLELRVYGNARSAADAERLLYFASFENPQGVPLKESLPVVSPHRVRFTLEQNGGVGRVFLWAIYQSDG